MRNPNKKRNKGGRPTVLDESKRRKVLALISNGSSLRIAARVVGCAHASILRAAQRDPQFAADLAAAEHHTEVEALRRIRRAADKDHYWRAAAWMLERKNPQDFAPRQYTVMSVDQMVQAFLILADPLFRKLPDAKLAKIIEQFSEFADAIQNEPELLKMLHMIEASKPNFDEPNPPAGSGFGPDDAEAFDELGNVPLPQLLTDEQFPPDPRDVNQP